MVLEVKKLNVSNLNWKARVALCKEWKKSGLSANEFCRQKGLTHSTFHSWCKKLKESDAEINHPPSKSMRYSRQVNPERNLEPIMLSNDTQDLLKQMLVEISLPNQILVKIFLSIPELKKLLGELCNAVTVVREENLDF